MIDSEVRVKAGPVTEHGPRAGVGFFRDLHLIEQEAKRGARNAALIGDEARSSFALAKYITVYHNRLNQIRRGDTAVIKSTAVKQHATPPSWKLDQGDRLPWLCAMPARPVSGYNYGPGTPTFYRKVADAPLTTPQVLLKEYRQQHSQQALSIDYDSFTLRAGLLPTGRKFGIVTIDCDASDDNAHDLMHSVIWAMLGNRTLL